MQSGEGAWNGNEIFDSLLHSDLLPVSPIGNQQPASMGGSQGTEPGQEGQEWMEKICCVRFLNPALHDLKGYIFYPPFIFMSVCG